MNPNVGVVGRIAAEMNRNIEEVRRKNLLDKQEIIKKPPTAFKKPAIPKVINMDFV